eukprot:CAMPEP_0116878908 /NCGR_PEP_ID=MMETSP0463-20121206/10656_1 /TAXON_ID=181622 /ORGANISM="Strombidinopsis sp, Strain SopsisLIS2011" /LENGTH=38 /DNA_ID= /DNA_START= /DNA_END= /DNA_ORIENTATION=
MAEFKLHEDSTNAKWAFWEHYDELSEKKQTHNQGSNAQ